MAFFVGFRPDVDLGDIESDVGLTADVVIELTTSVKTDVVINMVIIFRSCTTSVLSQKRRGEENTHVGFGHPTDVILVYSSSTF